MPRTVTRRMKRPSGQRRGRQPEGKLPEAASAQRPEAGYPRPHRPNAPSRLPEAASAQRPEAGYPRPHTRLPPPVRPSEYSRGVRKSGAPDVAGTEPGTYGGMMQPSYPESDQSGGTGRPAADSKPALSKRLVMPSVSALNPEPARTPEPAPGLTTTSMRPSMPFAGTAPDRDPAPTPPPASAPDPALAAPPALAPDRDPAPTPPPALAPEPRRVSTGGHSAGIKNVRGPKPPARMPEPPRTPPVLVTQIRGRVVESRHRGCVVEVGIDGTVRRVIGDPDTMVNLRSAVKPFGLVALVEAGGVEAFDLTEAELAIMAGSHSGEDLHVRTLQAVFRRAGVSQQFLGCGSEGAPLDDLTAARLSRDGEKPGPVRHMCSGQHASMLLLCRINEWPFEEYWLPDHPVQRLYAATVAPAFSPPAGLLLISTGASRGRAGRRHAGGPYGHPGRGQPLRSCRRALPDPRRHDRQSRVRGRKPEPTGYIGDEGRPRSHRRQGRGRRSARFRGAGRRDQSGVGIWHCDQDRGRRGIRSRHFGGIRGGAPPGRCARPRCPEGAGPLPPAGRAGSARRTGRRGSVGLPAGAGGGVAGLGPGVPPPARRAAACPACRRLP